MKKIIFTSVLLFSLTDIYSQIFSEDCLKAPIAIIPPCNNGSYYLAFEDNFDGNSLDLSAWEVQPWGQGALQTDANLEYNSMNNDIVSNGTLKINAKKEIEKL